MGKSSSDRSLSQKKFNKKWGIIGAVITVIVVIIIIIVSINVLNVINNNVNVTAVNITYTYYSSSGNAPPLTLTTTQNGFNATGGSSEIYVFKFNETIVSPYTLTINSISSNTQNFQLSSISPNLPYTITYGEASISVVIQLPSNSYTGVLSIYIIGTIGD
ncbi:hypothetical protein ACNF40_08705 [Cuniculiplasma sp. SKW4]|uniref:hypothetical protein n=1 Tax=Cuniculiplasma sp. SKW4 TaxID=3400171 RepID=UPI003FD1A954